jgi:hypothetical protein
VPKRTKPVTIDLEVVKLALALVALAAPKIVELSKGLPFERVRTNSKKKTSKKNINRRSS